MASSESNFSNSKNTLFFYKLSHDNRLKQCWKKSINQTTIIETLPWLPFGNEIRIQLPILFERGWKLYFNFIVRFEIKIIWMSFSPLQPINIFTHCCCSNINSKPCTCNKFPCIDKGKRKIFISLSRHDLSFFLPCHWIIVVLV